MTGAAQRRIFGGGCHCGGVRIEFASAQAAAHMVPRACDCSFCRKHGAAYVSDPQGRLRISAANNGKLRCYRQGSKSARFHLCAECGVLVAVSFAHGDRVYGAVNVLCLDAPEQFGAAVTASPQLLSAQEKVARWLQVWVADVQVPDTDA